MKIKDISLTKEINLPGSRGPGSKTIGNATNRIRTKHL